MRTLLRHPGRAWQVISVFARYFLAPALRRRRGELAAPVRLRLALEELGGAWIKLGQMLAMRFDLLPAPYCDELFKLLNQVKPFPYEQVREIIRRELGDVPEVLFASFTPESFAAASIGQVHRAVLPTGEAVAVKVQRPDVRAVMEADIDLMYATARLVDSTRLFGATRTRDVIDEFARWTADELDYLVEARQAGRLHANADGDRSERNARVYREYTSSQVLTSELIEGVPLIEIMYAKREGNTAYLDALAGAGYDLDRVVRHLDWNMLNQVYVHGYFHADPHPANLYVLPGEAIGYVDFGQVGQLSERVRDSLTYYTWLLFRGDVERAVDELMRWLAPTPSTDAAVARRRLVRAHEKFLYSTATGRARSDSNPSLARRPYAEAPNPYSALAVDIMQIIRDTQLTMSQNLVSYLKMLVTLGTLRHQLAVDYDLTFTVRRYFARMMRRRAFRVLDPRQAFDRLYAGAVRMERAIEFLEFLESQQPAITAGVGSLFGIRRRMRSLRRRLVNLGAAILVVGGALYFVLAAPDETQRLMPTGMSYSFVHVALLVVLVLLIVALVLHLRQFGRDE
jgi:predicted unusual protein kinase regulating ubiquinone biosynthesis (AarF/ABC1/UbiB family)